jgi:hypothetical protein
MSQIAVSPMPMLRAYCPWATWSTLWASAALTDAAVLLVAVAAVVARAVALDDVAAGIGATSGTVVVVAVTAAVPPQALSASV